MKKRIVKFLFLAILFLALPMFSQSDKNDSLDLTMEEKIWLANHESISVGIMDAWPPMDFVDEYGVPRGIGVDLINLMNKKLNNRLKIYPGPWKSIYEKGVKKELDMLMDITPRKEREKFFNFTRPYIKIPHVIISQKEGRDV